MFMSEFMRDVLNEPGLTALLGVIVGGLLTGIFNYLLERRRENGQVKLDLLKVRREVELEGLEAANHMVWHFYLIFTHNHEDEDEEADWAQAQAIEALSEQADNLRVTALRVDVLASREVGSLIGAIPDRIYAYFEDATKDNKIYAAKANKAVDDLRDVMEQLKVAVRKDLRTALIDAN